MKRYLVSLSLLVLLAPGAAVDAEVGRLGHKADYRSMERPLPSSITGLKLESPLTATGVNPVLDRGLVGVEGDQQVIVRLKAPSIARGGGKNRILAQQQGFLDRCLRAAPSARVIAETRVVLNAVFLEVDAADLPAIARDPAVMHIKPVVNYERSLPETVPYIGASAVQALGFDGSGVSVAVLDSGIDYTHADLGGPGTLADYAAAYGAGPGDPLQTTRDGLFPTAKVVEGFDFVGEAWPGGPLAPDPDPIDFEGHGTHVADIAGGLGGVAPGVDLYAVKVCSAVSPFCSGVALIQGMDFAVDPDGDGDPSDHVDVINMSLGASYGDPFDDDLAQAVENATALGVITVAAAGNGSDKPFVQGTPAAAPSAISVAQTYVPSAVQPLIDVGPLTGILAVFQTWSTPPAAKIMAPVQYGDGGGGNLNGCAAFAAGSLSGLIVLVDRGGCFFSTKIQNIEAGGGAAGIIGLVAPGSPFNGGFGGGPFPGIPGYMISQADSNAIKGVLPATGTIDPAGFLPLVGSMVGSSSRGPQVRDNRIKPEIGAPGASVSAEVGTGTGTTPFGGTSGASPMVAGSAALLLDARSGLGTAEVKALLMNTAEIDILNSALLGDDAPITRIGGGEVRVDRAAASAAAAWDDEDPASGGALSFGFHDVYKSVVVLHKTVRVRNYSADDISFKITPTFRSPGPEASGAVEVDAPSKIRVPGGSDRTFSVKMKIHGDLLGGNFMNSGSMGANGAALTANEFDGYLLLDPVGSGGGGEGLTPEPIHLAWHVLPRQAARVVPSHKKLRTGGFPEYIGLNNTGEGTAQNDAYSLLVLSPDIPEGGPGEQTPTPDIASVGINTFPVPAGFCSAEPSFLWVFALNTHERQRHLIQPVSHQISLDVDQDGVDDYVVLNRDLSFNSTSDGRQLSWVFDLSTFSASAFFFAEHATNTGNTVLIICGEQVGLTGTDLLSTNVDITSIFAQSFYYGGPGDEVVFPGKLTVTPLGERFFGQPSDVPGNTNIPFALEVYDFGPFPGNTPELGLLLFTNGDRGGGAHGGATEDTEALVFPAPGVVVP